jgi:hypothetical protein
LGALIFFREQWDSGFKWLMGDEGDTRLAVYLCEHWFQVFHGQASWLNPGFFYPVKGVLGWSDTFLLYEIFYAPLRLFGFDPYLSLQITRILLSLVGFCSFVYLVRLAFDTPLTVALICGAIFTFSNALWLHVFSVQLYGIYLVPAILFLGLIAWRSLHAGHRARAMLLAGIVGLLWALLLYSTYYIGWYSTLALVLTGALVLVAGGRSVIARAAAEARTQWTWLSCLALGFAVGMIPFARTYLPARHPTVYAQVMQSWAAHPRDLLDVGAHNVLWGSVVRSVDKSALSSGSFEISFAVTPIVMALTLVAGVIALWLLLSHRRSRQARARVTFALAATALILLVLPVNTRFGSLWAIVWHLPGASALRAIDRIGLITGLTAALAIAASGRDVATLTSGWRRGRAFQAAGLALLAIAAAEQVNTTRISYLNRPAEIHFLDAIKPAPSSCRAFFVVDSRQQLPYFVYGIDAMLVSQRLSLPTVNGYTGYFPPGWGLLRPWVPTYGAAVASWATNHSMANEMCKLDLDNMQWHVGD